MEEFTLKIKDNQRGFTLIEGLLAIAIALIGLVLIFSLIGLSLDINIKSQFLLADSANLNSLADQVRKQKSKDGRIDQFLEQNYPDFILIESHQTDLENLVILQVNHKDKDYYIAYCGGKDD